MKDKTMTPEAEMDALYSDGGDKEGMHESVDQETAEHAQETAIVPTKLLMGKENRPLEEGEEVTVKVVKVHGDNTEVAYAYGKEHGKEESSEKSPDEELEEMNQPGVY